MADQTAFSLSTQSGSGESVVFTPEEKNILRELAKKVADIAARPEQAKKRELWYRHNRLERTRPVIFCDPENGWNEIITQDQIKCKNGLARSWEMTLRKEIFWGEQMGDDRAVEPYFNVGYVYDETDWGMRETKIGGEDGGSYRWDAPLKDYDRDMERLRFPQITVNYEETNKRKELAEEILGDLLNVRIKSVWWWTLGMTMTLVQLRGLEQIMMDMYDYPDELHRLMAFLRDGHMHRLDFLEKNGLLSLNNDDTYVGSGGFGYTNELPREDFEGKVRTVDMWGFGESQETSQISAAMFEEFILPYQLPILERFGLNCYGCCEPLDKRWEGVSKVPRLRRVSVSPWCNMETMAELLSNKYIFSMKPNPAYLAVPEADEDYIRKSLRDAIQVTRNCCVEIIMKDNHTIGKNPQNVINWCKIAKEEAERFA